MRLLLLLTAALFLCVPAYADPMPDVFAVIPEPVAKSQTLLLDVFSAGACPCGVCACDTCTCGEGTAGPMLMLDVFSAGKVSSKPDNVPSPAVPVAPKPKPKVSQQMAPQVIQYAAPTCRYVWTRYGWMQTCQ